MNIKITFALIITTILSCTNDSKHVTSTTLLPIAGTWQLTKGTLIEKGDTIITDYTKNISFIKIINDTHFAFLQHDVNKGKDSLAVSGGGKYSLQDSTYIEHLEYCSAREWEGNDFTFTMTVKGDTLIQQGIEKIESSGVDRYNIEKYIKVKN